MTQDASPSSERHGLLLADGADETTGRIPFWVAAAVIVLVAAILAVSMLLSAQIRDRRRYASEAASAPIRVLEGMARRKPWDLSVRRQLAFAYQQAGRTDDALREYDGVLDREADDLASLYNSAMIHIASGDGAQGEKLLSRVIALSPGHYLAAKALGERYAVQERYDRVLAVVLPAAEAHPELADLAYLAGFAYERTGRKALAEERYRHALELIPDMVQAREGLDRLSDDDE